MHQKRAETATGVFLESKVGTRSKRRTRILYRQYRGFCDFNRGSWRIACIWNFGRIFGVLFRTRIVCLLLGALVLLSVPSRTEAKDSCPWINEATASGALDGAVTATVTRPETSKDTDEATCVFLHQSGSTGIELRIEVETLRGAPGAYAATLKGAGRMVRTAASHRE